MKILLEIVMKSFMSLFCLAVTFNGESSLRFPRCLIDINEMMLDCLVRTALYITYSALEWFENILHHTKGDERWS